MSGKKRQTFDKMNRERAVKEKRARKQEKKDQRKLEAQALLDGNGTIEAAEGEEAEAAEPAA